MAARAELENVSVALLRKSMPLPKAVLCLSEIKLGHIGDEVPEKWRRHNATNRMKFMLRPNKTSAALAGKVIDIYDFLDGRLEIRWKGLPLSYSVFDHLQRVSHGAIIENKRLGEVLAWIKQQQDKQPHHRGDLVGPRRSNQKASLMKDGVDRLAQGKKPGSRPAPRGRRRSDSGVYAATAPATSEAAE